MFDFMDFAFDEAFTDTSANSPYIPPASECLRCGMCISSCPTFQLFQIDEETPRRRLRTIGKLLVENQPVSQDERLHFENCLQCRACETICPSRMAFGQLYDQANAQLQKTPKRLAKLAFWLIENKRWRIRLMPLLAIYLKSGLQKPLRLTGLLKKLHLAEAEALLDKPVLQPLSINYPSKFARRGRVALFTGCIAEHFDRKTLSAAIELLNAIGYEVLVPPQQSCCGAIHQHNGFSAQTLIDNNIAVFNGLDVDAVLYTTSGCGSMLSEYTIGDSQEIQKFQHSLVDINEFLFKHWPEALKLLPVSLKVAVHEPCSQRNVLKNQQTVYALLKKIPDLDVKPLSDNHICCGAGGSYMLHHTENATQLQTMKKFKIAESQADIVVSSNYGCAVYLVTDGGEACHPLVLLARQLAAH